MIAEAILKSEQMCSVSGPCGHESPLEQAWQSRDHYQCPQCGLGWYFVQAPARILPSGFVIPGERTLVIEPQRNLPLQQPRPTRPKAALA